jgi:hypothetical protein
MFDWLNEAWALLWRFGLAGVVVAGLIAWAWFMPAFKKTALWLALLVGLTTASFSVGVHLDNVRWEAKLERQSKDAVRTSQADRDAAVEEFKKSLTPVPPGAHSNGVRDGWNDGFARD